MSGSILTVGLLSLYEPFAAGIILDIGNTVTIIFAVSVLAIEGLYFFKLKPIERVIFSRESVKIRIMDILGVIASVPVVVLWWLLDGNWVLSDMLGAMLVISVIKVFKIVSFKVGLIAYLSMVTIYLAAYILISVRLEV